VLQRGVGRMDRPLMDPPGQRRIASIHRGQHPSQVVDALGVLRLDLPAAAASSGSPWTIK
jgi:hypothetical protein